VVDFTARVTLLQNFERDRAACRALMPRWPVIAALSHSKHDQQYDPDPESDHY